MSDVPPGGTPADRLSERDRALSEAAELRSLAFRRDALLRVRELLAAAYPISERFGED